MGKLRSGSIRERPAVYFAQVSFIDEKGQSEKVERQAESQKQAKELLNQILAELRKRKDISVTSRRIRERRGGIFARVTYTDEKGHRRERECRAKNRTDAKEVIKRMLRDLDDYGSASFDASQMSFAQLADYYDKNYLVGPEYVDGRKVAGLRSYVTLRPRLAALKDFFSRHKVRSITHGDLERYRAIRLKTPVVLGKNTQGTDKPGKLTYRQRSIATVNRELALMRRVLNVAVRNGWITRSPFEMGDPLITRGDEKPRERILTRKEEERLLAACAEKRDHIRPIVICALDTGMRKGEILKLVASDLDFENRLITVRAFNTKTMRERQVAMSERLARALEAICARLPEDQEIPVFGITNDIKRAFNSARKAAGLPDLRFHDLRHTHATRLVASHMPLSEVGRVLGHTQANTTFRYVNANVETARRAASLIDEFNKTEEETYRPTVN